MSIFNPNAPEVQSPDYLSYSRGIGTSRIFSTLFGGAADIAEGWIKHRDEEIQTNLYKDAVSQTDAIAQPYLDALNADQLTPETGGVSGSSERSGPSAGSPAGGSRAAAGDIPQGLSIDAQSISRLQAAYQAGSIRQSYYDNQLLAMSKGLHAKYPGYDREVDQVVSAVTGKNPRNALMSDFYEEARANAASMSSEKKAWDSWISTNQEDVIVADPLFYQHQELYADPQNQLKLKARVSTIQAEDKNVQRMKSQLDLKAAQGQDVSTEAYGAGLDHANFLAHQTVQTVLDSSGDFMTRLQKAQTDPSSIDPGEIAALNQQAAAMKAHQLALVNKYISDTGLSVMIKDPQKLEAIRQAAIQPITDVLDALNNKEYGLANMNLNASRYMSDATTRAILQDHPIAQVVKSLQDIGGQAAVDRAISSDAGFADQYHQMLSSFGSLNAAAGTVHSASEFSDYIKPGIKSGAVKSSIIPKNIQDVVGHLMDPSVDPRVAKNYVEYLYGGDNMQFLQNFGAGDKVNSLSQQTWMYSQMVNPAVSERIKQLSNNDPELWSNYMRWAATNFTSLFKATGDEVNKAIRNRPYVQVQWNPETVQFEVSTNRLGGPFERGMFSLDPRDFNEPVLSVSAVSAVKAMNLQLASMKRMVELNGKDPNVEVLMLLHSMGIDESAGKEGSGQEHFFGMLGEAIRKFNDFIIGKAGPQYGYSPSKGQ